MKINLNGWQFTGEYSSPELASSAAKLFNHAAEVGKIKYEFVAVFRDGKYEVWWRSLKPIEAIML